MFELSFPLLLSTTTTMHIVLIVVLGVAATVFGILVALLRRKARIQLGPLVIEPSVVDTGDTTGPYPYPNLSPEETEPFDLAEIQEAMRASETLRAIEALRAAEAKLARENLQKSKQVSSVRSVRMKVCPLFILYEVTGNSPSCHVIPSDLRTVEVGRSVEGQIHSGQPNVSQRHFRLLIKPSGTHGRWAGYDVALEDCGSKNGTWVNGVRVEHGSVVHLSDGDIIEAASARYLFFFVLRGDS